MLVDYNWINNTKSPFYTTPRAGKRYEHVLTYVKKNLKKIEKIVLSWELEEERWCIYI